MKLIILDRDGVINQDSDAFVKTPDEWIALPGSLQAIARLTQAGWKVVLATNQSGLARGMYSETEYRALTDAMCAALAQAGADVEAVYHCPHHPKGKVAEWAVECDCRKPAPGMILRAAKELGVSLADSFMVGDKPSDIEAARAAGVGRAYIVQSDNAESSGGHAQADAAFRDLADCVAHLLSAPAT